MHHLSDLDGLVCHTVMVLNMHPPSCHLVLLVLLDFFDELDHQASPLTLHSSLPELVRYVQCGLHRIKA